MPVRIDVADGKQLDARLDFADVHATAASPDDKWAFAAAPGEHVETVAFGAPEAFPRHPPARVPPEHPDARPRHRRARRGRHRRRAGRLELRDGTRVLFLYGTPEEMGRQHGELLKNEIHDVVDRILYGVGVGSSLRERDVVLRRDRSRPGAAREVHRPALPPRDGRHGRRRRAAPRRRPGSRIFSPSCSTAPASRSSARRQRRRADVSRPHARLPERHGPGAKRRASWSSSPTTATPG